MEPVDIPVQILTDIRDEIRKTNERLDHTSLCLDATNERLDGTNERLELVRDDLGRRITESELRTATAIHEMAGTLGEVRDLLKV